MIPSRDEAYTLYCRFMAQLNAELPPNENKEPVIPWKEFEDVVWPKLVADPERMEKWLRFHSRYERTKKEAAEFVGALNRAD